MDGLDELFAKVEAQELKRASSSSSTPKVKDGGLPVASFGSLASSSPVAASQATLTPRRAALVGRLQQFRWDLADPAVREKLERVLGPEGPAPQEHLDYYLGRPQLARYTLDTELPRMSYHVTPRRGGPAADCPADIRQLYAAE
ncbi:unnamed protein product, partial [Polarella glacialis]